MKHLFQSSVGKKAFMGLTGIVLTGFAVGHLIGNLLIFAGPAALNAYALKLVHLWPLLWLARFVLIVAVVVHIDLAIRLTFQNRSARPVGYAVTKPIQSTFAGRTMLISGLLLLLYVAYHLLHFTFGAADPSIAHLKDAAGHKDVYAMVVRAFQNKPVAFGYIAAMAMLCLHLSHGIGSMFQSLGLTNERLLPKLRVAGRLIAWLLFAGYSVIPVSILLGWVKLPGAH